MLIPPTLLRLRPISAETSSTTRFAVLKTLFCLSMLALCHDVLAQHTFRARVEDAISGEPLVGASAVVRGTAIGSSADTSGVVVVERIPAGRQTLVFSYVGYEPVQASYVFPLGDPASIAIISLSRVPAEMEELSVSATRSGRTIADIPMRVETIDEEEISEKISMDPSNISMLLNESPGILVQQTSPTSANATIRIQGLHGRYTQILKDGFPLYGGFSGGLSVMQIPPLDLQQVEIIKGPASTLYGGDAIAGIVNLVSRTPTREAQTSLLVNATSAGGFDAGAFYQKRGESLGLTFLGSANVQRPYDAEDDFFTNLPRTRRLTLAPTLFYYGKRQARLTAGVAATFEEREGGDIDVISGTTKEPSASFFERTTSQRWTSRLGFSRRTGVTGELTLKNSISYFSRDINLPDHVFSGHQVASYSEASYLLRQSAHDLVIGGDFRTDLFEEDGSADLPSRDYDYRTAGIFVQDTWDIGPSTALESGLRTDLHNRFGTFVLPRMSLLLRATQDLSARIGGGVGYKAPTVFLEESEERAFRDVLPLVEDIRAERSIGGSLDVNYRALIGERLALSLNQAFYVTRLTSPLVPVETVAGLTFQNSEAPLRTRGLETNARISLDDLKLFLGYVYLDARSTSPDRPVVLTPAHKTYTVLVFEEHERMRLGVEAYYTGPQHLTDGASSPGYWLLGIMGERRFGEVSLFLNLENLLDTRQSRHAPLVTGPRSSPTFAEIWGPTDGFIVNGGLKFDL